MKKFPWIVQVLENREFSSNKVCLTTIHVTALYTSIDLGKGLRMVENMLKGVTNYPDCNLDIKLLKWVLDNSYFQYKEEWYKQVTGAAMGGNVSRSFADFVKSLIEQPIMENRQEKGILEYFRYRDDILLITEDIK